MRSALVAISLLSAAVVACDPPDCDRPDYGTCGNACCRLFVKFPHVSSEKLAWMLNSSLAHGGPDKRFFLQPTYESPYGFGDLRKYVRPGAKAKVSFIGQAIHLTPKHTFNDTVNFLILTDSPSATLKAFSISQIGGAYGDSGQNYKNIVSLLKSLRVEFKELAHRPSDGCAPAKAKPASRPEGTWPAKAKPESKAGEEEDYDDYDGSRLLASAGVV